MTTHQIATSDPKGQTLPAVKPLPVRRIRLSKLLPVSVYHHIWLVYPFIVLATMAIGLYYGSNFLLDEEEPSKEERIAAQGLNLEAEGALATVIAQHIEASGGIQSLAYQVMADEIVFSGLLETESQRYLFKSTVQPMRSASVHLISENQTFDFELTPHLHSMTQFEPSKELHQLHNLATTIAEMTAYSINPLFCAHFHPKYFNVENLRRTHRSGTPAIALDILCEMNDSYKATLFINEHDMRTFAVDTNLGTGQMRSYLFRYSSNSDAGIYPETIRLHRPAGKDWSFYYSRVEANYDSAD